MPYPKQPGVYFNETVASVVTEQEQIPLFIVQTATEITSIDGKFTRFDGIDSFKTITEEKGLTYTTNMIEQALQEQGDTNLSFYVYSIKTDTEAAFTQVVLDSNNIPEIKKIFYIEETKSASGNNLQKKIGALKTGLEGSADKGYNKLGFVVPYGTVSEKENETQRVLGLYELSANPSSRIGVIDPNEYGGATIGKILRTPYNEDVGFGALNTGVGTTAFNYTASQELTLQNHGILFIRRKVVAGAKIAEINLGVSTAFSGNAADGLLIVRSIADTVLDEVKDVCEPYVKSKGSEQNLTFLQTDVNDVIDKYVEREDLYADESNLTVTQSDDYTTINVVGQIKPARSTIAINVNTTIQ